MTSLLSEILKTIGITLRNEELHPKKETLRVNQENNVFTIQIRIEFLWVLYGWVDLCYQHENIEEPIQFNTLIEAIDFINEITTE